MPTYYSHVFDLPVRPPFDRPDSRFTSWIGEFVKPLAETGLCGRFWFTYYGDHVKFRVYTDQYEALRPREIKGVWGDQRGLEPIPIFGSRPL
jgi:hypothetical protein